MPPRDPAPRVSPELPPALAARVRRPNGRVLIVAELGTGHAGEIDRARGLLDAAAEAGADCAKFQLVYADEIIPRNAGLVRLPGGETPLYEVFKSLERPPEFYARLKEECEARGLLFLCSPFGLGSAAILSSLGVDAYKIASPELNHFPLLRAVGRSGRPLVLSSGVSSLSDIERALQILREPSKDQPGGSRPDIVLLHCITAYPAPEEEYNLRLIPHLAGVFSIACGLSDHSLDPVLVPALAVLEGAVLIEKHLTLDRGAGGLDDPIALPPREFARMSQAIRTAEDDPSVFGHLEERYGSGRVQTVLGDGAKRLAPSELANYGRSNRSLHAVRDLPRGHRLAANDLAILRTEHNLRPGLSPQFLELVIGRVLSADVEAGQGLRWEDLLFTNL